MKLTELSAAQLRRAADLMDQIKPLQNELEGLLEGDFTKMPNPIQLPLPRQPRLTRLDMERYADAPRELPRKRRKMSAATKAKISAAAKKRWRKVWAKGGTHL